MKPRMWFFMLIVLLLQPDISWAEQNKPKIKLVETTVTGRVTDGYGQPMKFPLGLHIIFFKFYHKAWEKTIWAHIRVHPDFDGRFQGTGIFPIDSLVMMGLVNYAGNRDQAVIDVGVQLLNQDDAVLACPNGVRFEIGQFGANPWPTGTAATISGRLDDTGRMWPKMIFPINPTTVHNFTLLTDGRGK